MTSTNTQFRNDCAALNANFAFRLDVHWTRIVNNGRSPKFSQTYIQRNNNKQRPAVPIQTRQFPTMVSRARASKRQTSRRSSRTGCLCVLLQHHCATLSVPDIPIRATCRAKQRHNNDRGCMAQDACATRHRPRIGTRSASVWSDFVMGVYM